MSDIVVPHLDRGEMVDGIVEIVRKQVSNYIFKSLTYFQSVMKNTLFRALTKENNINSTKHNKLVFCSIVYAKLNIFLM